MQWGEKYIIAVEHYGKNTQVNVRYTHAHMYCA